MKFVSKLLSENISPSFGLGMKMMEIIMVFVILSCFSVVLILTAVLSVVCAALWLGMFEFIGAAAISVLLTGLVAGYLISSIVFYTKFGESSRCRTKSLQLCNVFILL